MLSMSSKIVLNTFDEGCVCVKIPLTLKCFKNTFKVKNLKKYC